MRRVRGLLTGDSMSWAWRFGAVSFCLVSQLFVGSVMGAPAKAKSAVDYSSASAVRRAENLLLFQSRSGGWPRNVDLGSNAYDAEEQQRLREQYRSRRPPGSLGEDTDIDATLLDRATVDKIDYLARVYIATGKKNKRFAKAVERGMEYLMLSEGPEGGYFAFYPRPSFSRHWHKNVLLTSDVAFATVEVLAAAGRGDPPYDWVSKQLRAAASDSVERFREFLVQSQVRVRDGRVLPRAASKGLQTGWSPRYDGKTLSPGWGDDIDPRCLSPRSTAQAARWLMSLDRPTEVEKDAIHAAIAWLHARCTRPIGVTDGPRDHWPRCVEPLSNDVIFGDYVGIDEKTNRPIQQFFRRWDEVSPDGRRGRKWFVGADLDLLWKVYPEWRASHDPRVDALRDFDADGLVDDWEIKYGLDPADASDGNADSDGDGVSNLDEYYAATHPTVSIRAIEDRFYPNTRVTIQAIDKPGIEIRYSADGSEPGKNTRRYRKPIRINDRLTFKATAFIGKRRLPTEASTFDLVGKIHHFRFDGSHPDDQIKDDVGLKSPHVVGSDNVKRWAPGRIGNAFRVDGNGGYLSFSSDRQYSHQGAIAMWVYPEQESVGKRYLFRTFRLPRNQIELTSTEQQLAVRVGDKNLAVRGGDLPIKKWTHIALVWNHGAVFLFRNGELVDQGEYQDFEAAPAPISLGGSYDDATASFPGRLDDVQVYNRPMSAEEVKDLYESAPTKN